MSIVVSIKKVGGMGVAWLTASQQDWARCGAAAIAHAE
jgi:hypothetical protein